MTSSCILNKKQKTKLKQNIKKLYQKYIYVSANIYMLNYVVIYLRLSTGLSEIQLIFVAINEI